MLTKKMKRDYSEMGNSSTSSLREFKTFLLF